MRQFIAALAICLFFYAGLYCAGKGGRSAIWRRVRLHIVPILAIVLVLVLALVAMFYTSAISIL